MSPDEAYPALERRYERIAALGQAAGVLQWDQATVMPEGGAPARARQLATLRVMAHETLAHPETGELLGRAEARPPDDPWSAANLREMRRRWRHATAVPPELVEARELARSRSEMTWRRAREENDYAALAPELATLLDVTRQVAAAKGEALDLAPYDALLDGYDPGLTDAHITALFEELETFLPDLLTRVIERQASAPGAPAPAGPFEVPKQRALAERLMQSLGFDFRHGRLDTSHHPFTGGVPEDVRITTRWDESDFLSGLMAVLHETGHALYERGLPERWRLQPVGSSRGMTLHESQSLLVEMQACRSAAFIEHLAPVAREIFAGNGSAWDPESLLRQVHEVSRGWIRVDADEVSYPLHVMLRHDLERSLVAGRLDARDLPEAWNQAMVERLGAAPPDDRRGCLQDIHWPSGAFGYFPTYTLGALAAAQLFEAAVRAEPAIPDGLARGEFAPLMGWLAEHVHGRASLHPTPELIERATGAPLGTDVFRRHLERRYLA